MRHLVPALVVAAVLLPAGVASAATVHAQYDSSGGDYKVGSATYTAAPGERNALAVEREGSDTLIFQDTGATIVPGDGCIALDAHSARCVVPDAVSVTAFVKLGDGDDRLDSQAVTAGVGGSGDDRLTLTKDGTLSGGAGDDVLSIGGSGRLSGDGGDDHLSAKDITATGFGSSLLGGDGQDVLEGGRLRDGLSGGPGSDTIDGGGGLDVVSYAGSTTPVRVDLRVQRARTGPDHDTLKSVEGATGGHASDVLIGDAGPNRLAYGVFTDADHPDTIIGGGGDDILNSAGPAHDKVSGGSGDDTFHSAAGDDIDAGPGNDDVLGGRTIDCGTGFDRVSTAAGLLRGRCERVEVLSASYPRYVSPVRRGHGALTALATRPRSGAEPGVAACGVLVRVTRGDRTLAAGRLRFVARRELRYRLALTAAGRRAIAGARLEVRVRHRIAASCPAHGAWTPGPTAGSWLQLL